MEEKGLVSQSTYQSPVKNGADCNYGHPPKKGCAENSMQLGLILLVCQTIFIVLFMFLMDYETGDHVDANLDRMYPWFQDTHVMIVVGFGFLMTFLKRYGWGSVGFNFLFTGFTIQWALICTALFAQHFKSHGGEEAAADLVRREADNVTDATLIAPEAGFEKFPIGIDQMLEADFTTAVILISFGAVLGVATPVQLLLMIIFEVVFYNINAHICIHMFDVSDLGGSIIIHCFGAYFGLAVSRVIYRDNGQIDNPAEGTEYHSDLFSMIGTTFLWMFWPSFNSAPSGSHEWHGGEIDRSVAIMNTYLALSAACVTTFSVSVLLNPKRRITMEHVQNATLAGGVAMGTAANFQLGPAGALIVGLLAGALSTVGFWYIKPLLCEKLSLHDSCGVHNLHGMPAILAGLVSIVLCAMGAGAPNGSTATNQALALGCTLGLSLVTGAITGLILRLPVFESHDQYEYYEDGKYWEIDDLDEE
jgi:ammonium transporter Rh